MADTTLADKVAGLAEAFAEGSPTGVDPRQDVTPRSLYFRLRDARSDARAGERLADNDPSVQDGSSQHWRLVHDLAVQALSGVGKDIEIAAWLTESLVRSDGFDGLVVGATLLRVLVERFWNDGLFPLPDEEGPEARLAPVAGLSGSGSDGTLLQPLRKIVLFERADGSPVTVWQFEQAREVSTLGDAARRTQRLAAGVLPLDELDAIARGPGRASVALVAQGAVRASAAWSALERALGAVVPGDAVPSMRRVHDLLNAIRRMTEAYVPAVVVAEDSAGAEQDTAPVDGAPDTRATSRDAMLDEVLRIAGMFRSIEPNSPLGYTLEEAVRRARLSWPELLQEMLPEAGARSAVLSSLGIRVAPA